MQRYLLEIDWLIDWLIEKKKKLFTMTVCESEKKKNE